uniref:NADH-ubiquinone oxidoreductase chain 3 n=1 Tax=Hebesoma violentum TaxID=1410563 RepID=A0A0C4JU52_9BILA|nr:NADH dehydrogenase subunit 3 [Hebesoma violentum]
MTFLILLFLFLCGYCLVFTRSVVMLGSVKGFECGMDRMVLKGLYFSLRFFMVSLLFLLMDLELVLLIFSPIVVPGSVMVMVKFS